VTTAKGFRIGSLEHHSSLLRIMVLLLETGEINFQQFIDVYGFYPNSLYSALEKALEIGLVKQRLDASKYPPRNMISLTPKGVKVASKLKDIEELLE
jgi:DNA-binding PadR family transcriptional regulator